MLTTKFWGDTICSLTKGSDLVPGCRRTVHNKHRSISDIHAWSIIDLDIMNCGIFTTNNCMMFIIIKALTFCFKVAYAVNMQYRHDLCLCQIMEVHALASEGALSGDLMIVCIYACMAT
jgi:hypothetical protein